MTKQSNAATEVTRKVTVVDTTAPVIILNGDSEIDFALGSEYTDAGATVSDNLDTDLELVVENSVDASAVGVYQVKFNITDSTGNKATEVVRTVNVKDLTAPVIALAGDARGDSRRWRLYGCWCYCY